MLYEVARHNFRSFFVRDFDLETMNFGRLVGHIGLVGGCVEFFGTLVGSAESVDIVGVAHGLSLGAFGELAHQHKAECLSLVAQSRPHEHEVDVLVKEEKPQEFNAVLRDLLERYPDTDITPVASAWLRGMARGRQLHAPSSARWSAPRSRSI